MKEKKKKFYQTAWFSWLFLIGFSPLGITLLWANKLYEKKASVLISFISMIFFCILINAGWVQKNDIYDYVKENPIEGLLVAEDRKEVMIAVQGERKKQEPSVESARHPMTKDEFNQTYAFDEDYPLFPNGTFVLKNGKTVQADYYSYLGGKTFEYAAGIFKDGQIAHLQLDLKEGVRKEEVLAEFGFSANDVTYTRNKHTNVAEINVDPLFKDGNIYRFPFELD